jgi:hypothetical protein
VYTVESQACENFQWVRQKQTTCNGRVATCNGRDATCNGRDATCNIARCNATHAMRALRFHPCGGAAESCCAAFVRCCAAAIGYPQPHAACAVAAAARVCVRVLVGARSRAGLHVCVRVYSMRVCVRSHARICVAICGAVTAPRGRRGASARPVGVERPPLTHDLPLGALRCAALRCAALWLPRVLLQSTSSRVR